MTDREIFQKNLNDFLESSGKLQKDLADYVGAKYTTVSGWTRGISYPRADAMEKIAMFFGVPTSRLIGSADDDTPCDPPLVINNMDQFAHLMQYMSKEDYDYVVAAFDRAHKKMIEKGVKL